SLPRHAGKCPAIASKGREASSRKSKPSCSMAFCHSAIEPSRWSDMTKISIDITPPALLPLEQTMNTEQMLLSTVKVATKSPEHAKGAARAEFIWAGRSRVKSLPSALRLSTPLVPAFSNRGSHEPPKNAQRACLVAGGLADRCRRYCPRDCPRAFAARRLRRRLSVPLGVRVGTQGQHRRLDHLLAGGQCGRRHVAAESRRPVRLSRQHSQPAAHAGQRDADRDYL